MHRPLLRALAVALAWSPQPWRPPSAGGAHALANTATLALLGAAPAPVHPPPQARQPTVVPRASKRPCSALARAQCFFSREASSPVHGLPCLLTASGPHTARDQTEPPPPHTHQWPPGLLLDRGVLHLPAGDAGGGGHHRGAAAVHEPHHAPPQAARWAGGGGGCGGGARAGGWGARAGMQQAEQPLVAPHTHPLQCGGAPAPASP